MEEKGFSPAKIAVLGIILALFAGAGYFATRPGASSAKTDVAAATSPASGTPAAPAAPTDAASAAASPAQVDAADATAQPAASQTVAATDNNTPEAAPQPDQAAQSPAPVTPPPQTAMAATVTPASTATAPEPARPAAPPDQSIATASTADSTASSSGAPVESSKPKAHKSSQSSGDSSSEKVASTKPAEATPPPALSVLTPWWGQGTDSAFHVVAVGPASEKSGIVVVFSNDLKDPSAAGQQLHLKRDGQDVSGAWQPGTNNRVLALTDLQPGKYQLAIDGDVAASSSQTLGTTRTGVVYVK